MITGVWEDGLADIRGGATEREFDPTNPKVHGGDYLGDLQDGATRPAGGLNTLYWGREFSYEEVMGNFKKYIAQGLGLSWPRQCLSRLSSRRSAGVQEPRRRGAHHVQLRTIQSHVRSRRQPQYRHSNVLRHLE
ncbi:MAG: hypothetical protein WDN03_08165 [Rhizomicrobium sp.]